MRYHFPHCIPGSTWLSTLEFTEWEAHAARSPGCAGTAGGLDLARSLIEYRCFFPSALSSYKWGAWVGSRQVFMSYVLSSGKNSMYQIILISAKE